MVTSMRDGVPAPAVSAIAITAAVDCCLVNA